MLTDLFTSDQLISGFGLLIDLLFIAFFGLMCWGAIREYVEEYYLRHHGVVTQAVVVGVTITVDKMNGGHFDFLDLRFESLSGKVITIIEATPTPTGAQVVGDLITICYDPRTPRKFRRVPMEDEWESTATLLMLLGCLLMALYGLRRDWPGE